MYMGLLLEHVRTDAHISVFKPNTETIRDETNILYNFSGADANIQHNYMSYIYFQNAYTHSTSNHQVKLILYQHLT